MNLTNLLLLLILSVLATYVFTPWKGMEKGSTLSIALQFMLWILFFSISVFALQKIGLIN
jgi:hypothetical protein|tara:strand:- start:174 stop:353 length:180 start_codon:yes stop_codon:yes gene_type:complete